MSDNTTDIEFKKDPEIWSLMEKILRDGARKMLQQALENEVAEYLEKHSDSRDENGLKTVVRNGYNPARDIVTGIGKFEVKAPRIDDRKLADTEEKFTSLILPKYLRKIPSIDNLLPVLYLKGLSTNSFQDALSSILGEGAKGLSASNIVRLKKVWEDEYEIWSKRSLKNKKYAYIWVDGIYFNVRLGNEKSCILVVMGADENGKKELISVTDGYSESTTSWKEILLQMKSQGLEQAPKLAIGDGALGFWKAVSEVFPTTKHQRCWVHKSTNITDKMAHSVKNKASLLLKDIYMADTKSNAMKAYNHFISTYEAKYEKAVLTLTKDKDSLFSFYDFPAKHWTHIRTTNPIESTFATVRLRTKRTKGCGSRKATLSMVWKLCQEAEKKWYKLRGSELIPKILQGEFCIDGIFEDVA
jgi:putative transposase